MLHFSIHIARSLKHCFAENWFKNFNLNKIQFSQYFNILQKLAVLRFAPCNDNIDKKLPIRLHCKKAIDTFYNTIDTYPSTFRHGTKFKSKSPQTSIPFHSTCFSNYSTISAHCFLAHCS